MRKEMTLDSRIAANFCSRPAIQILGNNTDDSK